MKTGDRGAKRLPHPKLTLLRSRSPSKQKDSRGHGLFVRVGKLSQHVDLASLLLLEPLHRPHTRRWRRWIAWNSIRAHAITSASGIPALHMSRRSTCMQPRQRRPRGRYCGSHRLRPTADWLLNTVGLCLGSGELRDTLRDQ
jgi:hypothetical protein